MAISARQESPKGSALAFLVDDALRLWKEIPDAEIPVAVDAAIIEAGSFVATAGQVAKLWRGGSKKELHLGNGTIMNSEETREYLKRMEGYALPAPESRPDFKALLEAVGL